MPTMMITQTTPSIAVPGQLPGEDQDGGRGDGEGHATGRHQIAVPGRGRRVHPRQADDERHGADQPGDPDQDLDDLQRVTARPPRRRSAGLRAPRGFFRNIWSIRSVTTYPPTTFIVAKATATSDEELADGVVARAAMSIAPTRTIPWIEFAPDISGVCRVAGHLADDRDADEDRQREDRQGW